MSDKYIEKYRYDRRAAMLLSSEEYIASIDTPLYLQPSIDSYRGLLGSVKPGSRVLEIGAGMGENTEFMLKHGLQVHSTDISSNSIEVMSNRFAKYENFGRRWLIWKI